VITLSHPVVKLAQSLIQCPSVTPTDAGCQAILIDRLKSLGFRITPLPFGQVNNFWATHGDLKKPPFFFAGHTDVVPPGPIDAWLFPPFEGKVDNGILYGRGAVDMKGALAAMVIASERFLSESPHYGGSLGFLITGDEEGPGIHGTRAMIPHLKAQGLKMGSCLLGEPTSHRVIGDTLKIGRRGSLTGYFTIQGTQGHVAYPDRAVNPIHHSLSFLQTLLETTWDPAPSVYFPPTALQLVHLESGLNTANVIPGSLKGIFNFRFSTEVSAENLMQRVEAIAAQAGCPISIEWILSGRPFLTESGQLLSVCQTAIQAVQSIKPFLSTDGGTSDGRFIAPEGIDVVELGLCNARIHAVNECVPIADLEALTKVYHHILRAYFQIDQ
jgi:succinyl-diaminopimelate desuccinylase